MPSGLGTTSTSSVGLESIQRNMNMHQIPSLGHRINAKGNKFQKFRFWSQWKDNFKTKPAKLVSYFLSIFEGDIAFQSLVKNLPIFSRKINRKIKTENDSEKFKILTAGPTGQ